VTLDRSNQPTKLKFREKHFVQTMFFTELLIYKSQKVLLFRQSLLRQTVDFFLRVFVNRAAFKPQINFFDWSAEREREMTAARFKNFRFQSRQNFSGFRTVTHLIFPP